MREKGIPEWYIESCDKIKYMSKAHATTCDDGLSSRWFKVYYPIYHYASYMLNY